ncbi:MAG TPA: HAD family hydrolase [Dehalococcoidia bacterium]|nr:HAD family hydrolase [Dehalococcoidia bacterium]
MPLRAMLFDLWGTLFVHAPGEGDARAALRFARVQAALDALGERYALDEIRTAFDAAAREHERIHAQSLDISARGRTVLYLRHLDETLPDRLDGAAWRALDEALLTTALEVPPDVIPGSLDALAEVKALGLPTALVSNAGLTPGFVLRELLERAGLLPYLDLTFFSDEVELAKPAPAFFAMATGELGVEPAEAAFVGDQPVLDVLGPRQAGLWSVQLGDLEGDGIAPHARIAHLSELTGALRGLGLIA